MTRHLLPLLAATLAIATLCLVAPALLSAAFSHLAVLGSGGR